MMKVSTIATIVLLPALAHASEWTASVSRGIPFYTLQSENFHLTIVCDPEGTYNPTQDYIQADANGRALKGPVTLRSGAGSATLNFEEGTAFKQVTTPSNWTKALQILSSADTFSLENGNKIIEVTLASHLDFACK